MTETETPRRVAIIGGLRIPFCRAGTHYAGKGNKDMLTAVLRALVERYELKGQRLGDVAAGATFKHSHDWNLAREATLDSGLARETPAYDLQRACGTSLSACIQIGARIALGNIEAGIGAGVDSISDFPLEHTDRLRRAVLAAGRAKTLGKRLGALASIRPHDLKPQSPGVVEPHTELSMGQSCERMARAWKVSRESQDKLALASHKHANEAWDKGFYQDLVLPFSGAERDNNVRGDTSLEKLGKLRPSFAHDSQASLTAGNSSPLTDGAAGVLLASEQWARERGLPIQAYLVDS
ncbi:MAG: acetyl-CoA C-acetyltransferase, partial [Gammaproteobacteria bacterium]